MQDIAVIISNDSNTNDNDIIDSIKESGFKNVFIHWETNEYNSHNWTEKLIILGA